jgi:N-methylhydantoinase B
MSTASEKPKVDGVRLAVLSNRLDGVVRSMMHTLLRTGRSGVINTARDFSCCILSGEDELLSAAEAAPLHVLVGPDLIVKRLREVHPELGRGDAFLHNSPYHGNSHAADHCILVPVVDDAGVHRFTVMAKAHQADCGNSLPTTYHMGARDVYEEGALLFDGVKVQADYRDNEDIIRMCRLRMRVPEQWYGDYLALLGAARVGERRMLELGAEVGWEELEEYVGEWFDYSEQLAVEAIRRLPSGRHRATSVHDPFPGIPDGLPVNVEVGIDADAALIEVDLRDNADCLECGLNVTEACAASAALLGVVNSIHEDLAINAGCFRRIRVRLRENCCVGIPVHPVSCSAATTNLADRVTNAVHRAMSEFGDGIGLAELGMALPASIGVVSGVDPRTGEPYVNELFLGVGGGGAGPHSDGWLTIAIPCSGGMILRDSVELDELRHPIRVETQRIVPDTEAAGRWCGSPGVLVEYGPVGASMSLLYAADAAVNPALGVRGGEAGPPAIHRRRLADGSLVDLQPVEELLLADGERVVAQYPGGGGYGPALERDPEAVRRDVREGWISADRAREVYGVALDPDGLVDRDATEALRRALGGSAGS